MSKIETELKQQANALQVRVSDEMSTSLHAALRRESRLGKSAPAGRTALFLRPMPLTAAAALVAVLVVAGGYRALFSNVTTEQSVLANQSDAGVGGQVGKALMEKFMGAANAEHALLQEWQLLKSDLRRVGTVVRGEIGLNATATSDDAA